MGQLQMGLRWGINSLTHAERQRYADESACSRWMQHAGTFIQTSGGLAEMQF
jgi:hypothetical protein